MQFLFKKPSPHSYPDAQHKCKCKALESIHALPRTLDGASAEDTSQRNAYTCMVQGEERGLCHPRKAEITGNEDEGERSSVLYVCRKAGRMF